jgi:two-component system phosphate regulon sensor histidine kinase PhoR
LFFVSLAMILGVGLTSGAYLENTLRAQLETRIGSELLHYAHSARDVIEVAPVELSLASIDALADGLGRSIAARVTVVARDGRVLGDSELEVSALQLVENHRSRPEIQQAWRDGSGSARRFSTTIGHQMLYVAVPYRRADEEGVVRVAMSLEEIDDAVSELRWRLLVAGLLGIAAAVVMSLVASHLMSRTLRRMVTSVRSLAEGGGTRRISVPSDDELGGLAGSINRMSEELERMMANLVAESDRLAAVLEGMGDGVLALDEHGRITHVNRMALTLLDLRDSPVGKKLLESIRAPALHELLSRARAGERLSTEFELMSDTPRRLLASATSQRATGGTVIVIHDVSTLRRLQTIRQDFVANVSHELRTPVSVIRANAETLLGGALEDPDRARDFLEALQRNAERLSVLIADLLDLSRIESREYSIRPESVELSPSILTAVEDLSRIAEAKRLCIEVQVDLHVKVLADSKALEQVVFNLLDNAIKYTQEEGEVHIVALQEGDFIRIEFRDNGPGIERKHRTRIFERFYRVDAGRSREMGGTGLGLSIVKHLVEAMNGQVGVERRSPQGSIFWFTLPATSNRK